MKRGHVQRGRTRVSRGLLDSPSARPLVRAVDHGPSVRVDGSVVGASGERWIEPFLDANRGCLQRLGMSVTVETRGGVALQLTPGTRIGAMPLLSPASRRVVAGLLISPRFQWSALGAVLGDTGFATEPTLGGTPLVPGSAREVPVWLLAAPVIRRLEGYLKHRKRGFAERQEVRMSPRGRVDWARWARSHVPSGDWGRLPCHYSEPDDDPQLMAAVRWTLGRLDEELAGYQEAAAAKVLRARVADLRVQAGPGIARRPIGDPAGGNTEWIADAIQAIGWVAEERGLGGSRVLDGLGWDLAIDQAWEAWVDAFVSQLAPRCGMTALRQGQTRRSLTWSTATSSMRMLIPDSGLRGTDRVVWVDAKYKAHLHWLSRRGWSGIEESTREAHRADLHQALAYAALDDIEQVDSVLVYPELSPASGVRPAIATLGSGRRRVRLMLVGLPFGFSSPDQRERALGEWRELLAA